MKRNLEALKQLKRVVKAAPAHLLHMRTVTEKAECGTAYCAAGWAARDKWFKDNTEIGSAVRVGIRSGDIDFDWIAEVFGLGEEDTSKLFGGNLYPGRTPPHAVTKKAVLDNIDRLLEGGRAEWYKVERSNS